MSGVTQPSLLDPREEALSISTLYDEVDAALSRAFPKRRSLWVRGEIQSITDRTGHCYIDLIDPEGIRDRQSPVLKVKCWRTSWDPMRTSLERQGILLEPGMIVVIRGVLDFYKPRAELGFLLAEVDVAALLGRLAQSRAALIEVLRRERLLDRNKLLPVPEVPLLVGLVASTGTEGHRDFVGQLQASEFAFEVELARASVQGGLAAQSIAGALAALDKRGCDVVVIVRGGGSKADLATFDTEAVARSIAGMSVPVWVGVGHTGDESVADIVANRSFVTPTDCAKQLVAQVADWWESVSRRAGEIGRAGVAAVEVATRHDESRRHRLSTCALRQLQRDSERLRERSDRLVRLVPRQVEACSVHLAARAERLGVLSVAALDHQAQAVVGFKRLITAFDIERQLERGYTLTYDSSGRLVRSASELEPGGSIRTRFKDGSSESSVDEIRIGGEG